MLFLREVELVDTRHRLTVRVSVGLVFGYRLHVVFASDFAVRVGATIINCNAIAILMAYFSVCPLVAFVSPVKTA